MSEWLGNEKLGGAFEIWTGRESKIWYRARGETMRLGGHLQERKPLRASLSVSFLSRCYLNRLHKAQPGDMKDKYGRTNERSLEGVQGDVWEEQKVRTKRSRSQGGLLC